MKNYIFIIHLLFPIFQFAQYTTYSKEEERMVQYANNGLFYAVNMIHY